MQLVLLQLLYCNQNEEKFGFTLLHLQRWAAQVTIVAPHAHCATIMKFLRQKRLRNPPKIIAPQVQAQV